LPLPREGDVVGCEEGCRSNFPLGGDLPGTTSLISADIVRCESPVTSFHPVDSVGILIEVVGSPMAPLAYPGRPAHPGDPGQGIGEWSLQAPQELLPA